MEVYDINRSPKYLATKYFPKTSSDLTINEKKINMLTQWIDSYESNSNKYKYIKKRSRININIDDNDGNGNENDTDNQDVNKKDFNSYYDKSCCIITGPHGVGKTTLVMTILEEKNYIINKINFEKINKVDDIDDFINKISTNNIYSLMINGNNKKRVIVVDNVENIITTNEKLFITNLIKLNELEWLFPIIFICNDTHNKIINLIKKIAYKITINYPTHDDVSTIFYKIAVKENIRFKNEDICNKIIKQANNDLRILIEMLESIKNLYNKKIINDIDIDNFLMTRKVKDQDISIFTATKRLLYKFDSIDEIIRIFETEKTIIPLMIQQHYIKLLGNKNFDTIKTISSSLSKGDIIENYIYDHNAYDIRDTQAVFHCINPSFIISNKLNAKSNPIDNFNPELKYPIDLNKTSIKRINYTKNILPVNIHFKNMKLNDYIYVNKILYGLIKSEQYDEINNLIKDYNIDMNIIESVLKINKITGEKFIISTKTKKLLTKSCPNLIESKSKPQINRKVKFKNKKV